MDWPGFRFRCLYVQLTFVNKALQVKGAIFTRTQFDAVLPVQTGHFLLGNALVYVTIIGHHSPLLKIKGEP